MSAHDNESKKKKPPYILVIGGGFLQIPLIETTKRLGYGAIVFDGNPGAPGMSLAALSIHCDTSDAESCQKKALELKKEGYAIEAVVTAGTDMSYTVALIAETLGLPGIRPEDALAATNKVLMRRRLKEAGILQPRFSGLWKFSEAHEAMDWLGLPLVIKPAQNMGARGVRLIRRREEIYEAFRHAKKFSKGELILEEYIPGQELSVDALAWTDSGGKRHIEMTGIADRIITGEPWFVELGHTMPSQKPPEILKKAEDTMRQAMEALGIFQGAAKGDLRITEDGEIAIGEVAARLSGGFMSSHTFPLSTGIDLIEAAIHIALGKEPKNLSPTKKRTAIERCLIGPPGKIQKIGGLAEMKKIKDIHEVYFMKKKGDVLYELKSNIGKAGHIIAVADSLSEAEAAAKKAKELFQIEVDDSYGVEWSEVAIQARKKFGEDICIVCKSCDGQNCASGMPGMGGPGRMRSFIDNSLALAEYKIKPSYIHKDSTPNLSYNFLGYQISFPVMIAPMTGASTNMGGAIGEYELARTLLEAASEMGSLAWLGDGASPERYKTILAAIRDSKAPAVLICKPRSDTEAIRRRFGEAEEAGVLALGMDIDALSLKTLELRQKHSVARDPEALLKIREMTSLPFIVKGILSEKDAQAARDIESDAIVVSNHGGRILDEMPGTARVLPSIAAACQLLPPKRRKNTAHAPSQIATKNSPSFSSTQEKQMLILADGGVRSGADAFKMLALGAEAVLVGRMAAIAAVGGGKRAVKFLLRSYKEELRRAMKLCGIETIPQISREFLLRTPQKWN